MYFHIVEVKNHHTPILVDFFPWISTVGNIKKQAQIELTHI